MKNYNEIRGIRSEIDRLDRSLIDLLGQRNEYIRQLVELKTEVGEVWSKERVDEIIKSRVEWAMELGVNASLVEEIYKRIIVDSIIIQIKKMGA